MNVASLLSELVDITFIFFLFFVMLKSYTLYKDKVFEVYNRTFFKNYTLFFNVNSLLIFFKSIFNYLTSFFSILIKKIYYYFKK